jgi:hypothetical protein
MSCPPETAEVLLQILMIGILRIRALGWAGFARRCAVEADHIHNLPELLRDYSDDRLRYYWEAERPAFISQSAGVNVTAFEPLWAELGRHLSAPAGG